MLEVSYFKMSLKSKRFLGAIALVLVILSSINVHSGAHALDLKWLLTARLTTDTSNCEGGCTTNAVCEDNKCVCIKGFFGDGNTCYQTPCYSSPCKYGGICSKSETPTGNDFNCICLTGFTGDTCEKTVLPCSGPELGTEGNDEHGAKQDSCPANGEDCREQISLLTETSAYCLNDGKCYLEKIFLEPQCISCLREDNIFVDGICYQKTGTSCDPNTGLCAIDNSECKNNNCVCKNGFVLDESNSKCRNKLCENKDDCGQNAVCSDGLCKCNTNYIGDGISCTLNSCSNSDTCGSHATCTADGVCECISGYFQHGSQCYQETCDKCLNGGTCVASPNQNCYTCICEAQYTGNTCEKKLQEKCDCLSPYSGDKCEDTKPKYQNCKSEPCLNGGECKSNDGNDGFTCDCSKAPGFTGSLCQEREYQSYMQFPRIHFSGRYQADVSTINNLQKNYDSLNFKPSSANRSAPQGGWNPTGSGNFRILDAQVTRVCNKMGICTSHKSSDPMVGATVKDGGTKASAKMVDLDVAYQVSEIWSLLLNVEGFFKGHFERSCYQRIWTKIPELQSMPGFGARYQSVLTNVLFGPKTTTSEVAEDLKMLMGVEQKLSISFNLDMQDVDYRSTEFTFGRIVGSIGISGRNSPPHSVYGRMLKPLGPDVTNFYDAPFVVDNVEKKIFIDLGNSLAMDTNGNVLDAVKRLGIGSYESSDRNNVQCKDVTIFDYLYAEDLYDYFETSGIYVLQGTPVNYKKPFAIVEVSASGNCRAVKLVEHQEGIHIQVVSHWLVRLEFRQETSEVLFMTVFGEKPEELEKECAKIVVEVVEENSPELIFSKVAKVNDAVTCKIDINAQNDPSNVRKFVDGQVYHLEYHLDVGGYAPNGDPMFSNSKILVLVWNNFPIPDDPNWLVDIQPIFRQFANLYPVMKVHFVDLGNYFDVVKNKDRIFTTMSLDRNDPNYMPVTRDLSQNKVVTINKWLKNPTPPFGSRNIQVTVEILQQLLRTALQLEHATLPPYLSGFLSIKKGQNQEVKDILRDIMIDEMFHLAQVANILNAIGANPDVVHSDFITLYPGYLPGGVHPHVKITIDKVSIRQIQEVYMEIEKPFHELESHGLLVLIEKLKRFHASPRTAKTENKCQDLKRQLFVDFQNAETNHNTIGELYTAILWVLASLTDCGSQNEDMFEGDVPQLNVQHKTRKVSVIKSYYDALDAIENIIKQGEGASPCNPMDAVGSSTVSHYYLFSSIVHKKMIQTGENIAGFTMNLQNRKCTGDFMYSGKDVPFHEGGVWPVVKDPTMSSYKVGSHAYTMATTFNEMYSKMLHSLQMVFNGDVGRFEDSIGLMKSLLVFGDRLVQTPIDDDGDPEIGPNAGPTYTTRSSSP